jgi:7-cyano-7-deazaguanine synthase
VNGVIVLLSGGLDSLVSLAKAIEKEKRVMALTFDYGQRAREREIQASKRICSYYKIGHKIIKLDWLKKISLTPLVKKNGQIPGRNISPEKGAKILWVPNRNGVMINIAAAFAQAMGFRKVVIGTNAEEGRFFSDNTEDFIKASNDALHYSTRGDVKVISYTGRMKKREILRTGLRLRAPIQYLWSCYAGGKEMCLKCHSCGYVADSLRKEGIWDSFWNERNKVRWS